MAFTQDFRTQRRNYPDGETRLGEKDRLWYDPDTNTIRIGDGVTPGGNLIGGANTFKTWKVVGQEDLVAAGSDVIRVEAGSGLLITTDSTTDTKTIRFDFTGELSGFSLATATTTEKGGVVIGNNLSITNDGVVAVQSQLVVDEVLTAPVTVINLVENQGLLYKNNQWVNSDTMFWSSINW